ncbi:hypothetical protein T4D_5926 [Trichinella pseudospiralis]|uniref:Uncharacterized protein n=1 Tax=Trichinella pseudospiralis TaxID=6337 RepID=A0A0V1DR40_TRIPS|nr:hypothetical protein T4D_5926 [Trichinella pseudospiralis]
MKRARFCSVHFIAAFDPRFKPPLLVHTTNITFAEVQIKVLKSAD